MRSNPFSGIAATLLGGDLEAYKKEARPREGRKACKRGGKTKNARLTAQIGTGQLDKKRQAESRKIKDGLKYAISFTAPRSYGMGKVKSIRKDLQNILREHRKLSRASSPVGRPSFLQEEAQIDVATNDNHHSVPQGDRDQKNRKKMNVAHCGSRRRIKNSQARFNIARKSLPKVTGNDSSWS